MAKVEGIYDEKGILREVFPHIFRTEVSMLQDLCEVKKRLLELKGELPDKALEDEIAFVQTRINAYSR